MDPTPDITPPPVQLPSQRLRISVFGSRTLLVLNELSILFAMAMRALVLPRLVAAVEEMDFVLPSVTTFYAAVPLAIHILALGALGAGLIVKEFLISDVRWRLIVNMLCGLMVIVYLVGLIFALFMPIPALMENLAK